MKYLSIVAVLTLMVGCQSSKVIPEGGADSVQGTEEATTSGINGIYSGGGSYNPYAGGNGESPANAAANNGDYYNNPNYGQNVVGGPRSQAKDRVIYFGFDSASIDSRAQAIINAHAAYLKRSPRTRIVLAGHTDSRGSRGYNIALGERRALSVKNRFRSLGVRPEQIRVISYGEERPAVNGYSESAYQRNRRAVIQY